MLKSEYDSVLSGIEKAMAIQTASKNNRPVGSLDYYLFKALPDKTPFYMVWALGPQSWITPAETRKIHSQDSRDDHMGDAWVIDWREQFPFTNKTEDQYKDRDYRIYATDYYSNYNIHLDPQKNYNDSYIFLDEEKALQYLAFCKTQPRFKTQEEEDNHKATMAELSAISDRMEYDYISDTRWDD